MDPDANLEDVAYALKHGNKKDAAECKTRLLNWLRRGGFPPKWSKYPKAAKYVQTGVTKQAAWPKLAEIAAELRDANKIKLRAEDADEGIDVRLQVGPGSGGWANGKSYMSWQLHVGPSDYDQDHRGYWGASSVPGNNRRFNATAVARDLLEQAKEHHAQGED
jgi:hypothetical protein